ncbi:ERCC4 domain-containing protein [Bacillus mycoides]|uniref:ERCC4 domain-containing protein n=1 Tax=Bacillus mycoides TaxID=1405 RepID=UPI002111F172|nr:ERCC4 domain-containing protein [Bacillus mycoides]MCQ6529858.1 ERCC4 domain-containing protein [Bacillus mycoides]
MIRFHYTDKEIEKILKTLTIIMDSREKSSMHIVDYFNQKEIPMIIKKLDVGDYSFMIRANPELGIMRDIYFNSFVERKNSVDEICGNLQKDKQQAFINELIRSQESKFVLFVEDPQFDENIAKHNYRSRYDPKALKGRLESFKAKYNFEIVPMRQTMIGHNIYHRFLYQAKHYLRTGIF